MLEIHISVKNMFGPDQNSYPLLRDLLYFDSTSSLDHPKIGDLTSCLESGRLMIGPTTADKSSVPPQATSKISDYTPNFPLRTVPDLAPGQSRNFPGPVP